MRRILAFCLFTLVLALPQASWGQGTIDFSGRVFNADTKTGVENLEVKLTPPRTSNLPIRLASTDRSGGFVFRKLTRGRYLIEISQGLHLLYRTEVDATRTSRLDVPLRPRR